MSIALIELLAKICPVENRGHLKEFIISLVWKGQLSIEQAQGFINQYGLNHE
jgi:hypothetical protein